MPNQTSTTETKYQIIPNIEQTKNTKTNKQPTWTKEEDKLFHMSRSIKKIFTLPYSDNGIVSGNWITGIEQRLQSQIHIHVRLSVWQSFNSVKMQIKTHVYLFWCLRNEYQSLNIKLTLKRAPLLIIQIPTILRGS